MTLHASVTEGTPVPQGSKSVSRTGRVFEANKAHKAWRATVAASASRQHEGPPIDEPVSVELVFWMPAPKRPRWKVPAVKPDLDKLTRSILDSLQTGGVLSEDSRVVHLTAQKAYVPPGQQPGVTINIQAAQPGGLTHGRN